MSFKDYFKKNKGLILLFPLVVIVVYLPIVFSKFYCADLEYVQGAKGQIYNWRGLGRYTLIILKKISFTPYNWILEGILFIITAFLTVNALAYFLHLINEKAEGILLFILSDIALIFPTFAEQYYFKFQSAEVMFGIFLLCLSSIFLMQFIKPKGKLHLFILSLLINIVSFGIYQSMFNILLVMYIGIFLVLCVFFTKENKLRIKAFLTVFIQFILSFAANRVIIKVFHLTNGYFDDKIMWKQYSVKMCLSFLKHYVRVVLLSESPMYTFAFIVSIVLSFAALIFLFIKNKSKGISALFGFAEILIAPFAIAIIQGFEPDSRTQLALPFSIAFLLFFAVSVLNEYEIFKEADGKKDENILTAYIALFALIFVLCLNIYPTYRLTYTRMLINKSDNSNIEKIAHDLKDFNCSVEDTDPLEVIFIGTLPYDERPFCVKYDRKNRDYILIPVFSLDADTAPQYFFSTNRILSAMENAGYNFKKPQVSNNVNEAKNIAYNMPAYPENGYIEKRKHFVVVNLGNY
ncbi:MAG: glucosyltransferase domain-containing protein [Lachnospiraceae bacterium]|nr:glucosyltransferase domain-containing protein [Lachnospiraceae bacterium]